MGSLTDFYRVHHSRGASRTTRRVHLIETSLAALDDATWILDLGCGDGTLTAVFRDYADRVVGIELYFEACVEAGRRGLDIVRGNADGPHLPFRDGAFDAVVAGEILEHVLDPDALLDEAARVLRPGGRLVLTTPNLACWYNRLLLPLGFQPYFTEVSLRHSVGKAKDFESGVTGHLMVSTRRALEALLRVHRFEPLTVGGADVRVDLPRVLSITERVMAYFPSFASLLVVTARKGSPREAQGVADRTPRGEQVPPG